MKAVLIALGGLFVGVVITYLAFWAWAWRTWSRDH